MDGEAPPAPPGGCCCDNLGRLEPPGEMVKNSSSRDRVVVPVLPTGLMSSSVRRCRRGKGEGGRRRGARVRKIGKGEEGERERDHRHALSFKSWKRNKKGTEGCLGRGRGLVHYAHTHAPESSSSDHLTCFTFLKTSKSSLSLLLSLLSLIAVYSSQYCCGCPLYST